jgi:hypothetical protein
MELLGDLGHMDLVSVRLETTLLSMQGLRQKYHRLKNILNAPDGTPR